MSIAQWSACREEVFRAELRNLQRTKSETHTEFGYTIQNWMRGLKQLHPEEGAFGFQEFSPLGCSWLQWIAFHYLGVLQCATLKQLNGYGTEYIMSWGKFKKVKSESDTRM